MDISPKEFECIKRELIKRVTSQSTGDIRSLSDYEFFEVCSQMGWNQHNAGYRALIETLANWIKGELGVGSAMELGSGPGYLISCLNYLGINTIGIDGNRYSQKFFQEAHPAYAHQYCLDKFFEYRYSPAQAFIAIEVFEHIPDEGLIKILNKVREEIRPEFIVFSSTPYADIEPAWDVAWGHCNIKQPDQWVDFFKNFGYELSPLRPPITEWASLYVDSRSSV